MNKKHYQIKLNNLKKKWPSYLKPRLQPNGQLRVVKSLEKDALENMGINTIQDLLNIESHSKSGRHLTEGDDRAIKELIKIVEEMMKNLQPPVAISLLKEFCPEYFEEFK